MITVTPASADEIPVIQELARTIWRAHYPGIISKEQIEYMLQWMYHPGAIQRDWKAGFCYHLVWDGTRPIGFLSYRYDRAKGVELSKLYLLPEYHNRGIGQQMLDYVKCFAKERGANRIYLNVNKQNHKAIKAYKKAGFEISEAVVREIGNGYIMDDYIMTYSLPCSIKNCHPVEK